MGGGTSIGIHVNGLVVDVNNALDGDGPFAIERAGTVPAGDWMRWVLAHQHDPQALQLMLTGRGGLVAYLGTNDFPAIEQSAEGSGAFDKALSDQLIQALCYRSRSPSRGWPRSRTVGWTRLCSREGWHILNEW